MARKTAVVQITAEGRDQGKSYVITEMPALKAEKWAWRAMIALGRSGIDIPDGAEKGGMAALFVTGVATMMRTNFDDIEPLLDEMMECVAIMPDPASHPEIVRPLVASDIEEVKTFFTLRMEVFKLHTGFSLAGARSE